MAKFGPIKVEHSQVVDVFISYSSADRERAQYLAKCLEHEGFDVWWDREIPIGRDYQEVLAEQISKAACVVVLWSKSSVKSRWVRSEATEGLDRGNLLPLLIDKVKPPFGFGLVQSEDFSEWNGNRDGSSCWARLILQVSAMSGRSFQGSETNNRGGATWPEVTQSLSSNDVDLEKKSDNTAWLTTMAAFGGLWTIWEFSPGMRPGPFAITITLATVVLVFFRSAEKDISPRMRAIATQWLNPRNSGLQIKTSEVINQIFIAVFGPRHLSEECFFKAGVASLSFLALLIVLYRLIYGPSIEFTAEVWVGLLLYGCTVNLIGDYAALYNTRLMLQWYQNGGSLAIILPLNAALTLFIFVISIFSAISIIYIASVLGGNFAILEGRTVAGAISDDFINFLRQPLLEIYEPKSKELYPLSQRRLLYISAVTTFLTTIWFWAALLTSPIVRLLVWILSSMSVAFDVHKTPFVALGYLSAIVIIVIGGGVWGVSEAIASSDIR